MVGKSNENLFRFQKLQALFQSPLVLLHQITCDKNEASVLAVEGMNKATEGSLLGLFQKLFKFAEFFEGLVPELMWFVFDQFELEITNIFVFEKIGDFCGTVDDKAELVAEEELVVLKMRGEVRGRRRRYQGRVHL